MTLRAGKIPLRDHLLTGAASNIHGMHGLIGKMIATEGNRAELVAALRESTADMPGCLSYVVAEDPTDQNALWVTEVWVDEASHRASLERESVQRAIARARPVIAGFGERFETRPLFGVGLKEER